MAKKYTDEQLSRILGECDRDNLTPGGALMLDFASGRDAPCCVNQAAYLVPNCSDAYDRNPEPAGWFDVNYQLGRDGGNPDELLRQLERLGAA